MKQALLLLFMMVMMAFTAAASHAMNETYYSADGHFTVEIPRGWEKIPKVSIKKFNKLFKEIDYVNPYIAGFRKQAAAKDNMWPYVLISVEDIGMPFLMSQVKEAFKKSKGDDKKYLADLEKAMRDKMQTGYDLREQEEWFDEKARRSYVRQISEVNGTMVRSYTVSLFCSYGQVMLTLYDRDEHFMKSLPIFEALIRSVRFDEGYSYDEAIRTTYNEVNGNQFYSSEGHFTVTIPQGWVQIPTRVVTTSLSMMAREVKITADINAAFQKSAAKQWFDVPHLSISVDKKGPYERKHIENIKNELSARATMLQALMQKNHPMLEGHKGMKLIKFVFDEKNSMLRSMLEIEQLSGGKKYEAGVFILTSYGLVNINSTHAAESHDRDMALFEKFVSSIIMDEGYTYDKADFSKAAQGKQDGVNPMRIIVISVIATIVAIYMDQRKKGANTRG